MGENILENDEIQPNLESVFWIFCLGMVAGVLLTLIVGVVYLNATNPDLINQTLATRTTQVVSISTATPVATAELPQMGRISGKVNDIVYEYPPEGAIVFFKVAEDGVVRQFCLTFEDIELFRDKPVRVLWTRDVKEPASEYLFAGCPAVKDGFQVAWPRQIVDLESGLTYPDMVVRTATPTAIPQ